MRSGKSTYNSNHIDEPSSSADWLSMRSGKSTYNSNHIDEPSSSADWLSMRSGKSTYNSNHIDGPSSSADWLLMHSVNPTPEIIYLNSLSASMHVHPFTITYHNSFCPSNSTSPTRFSSVSITVLSPGYPPKSYPPN